MDKFIKFAVVVSALLASGGMFYHYVIFLPALSQMNNEQHAAEKLASTEATKAKQQAYELCDASARKNYASDWARACIAVADDAEAGLRNCLIDQRVMKNQRMSATQCKTTFSATDPSGDCILPNARAALVNSYYTESKDKCLAEAAAGL